MLKAIDEVAALVSHPDFESFRKDRAAILASLTCIHILGEDGKEITATNNRMISEKDIEALGKGQEMLIRWEILNIFSDGKFYVTVTLADSISTVYDWYQEAASFTIKRSNRSTTAVLPPIKVKKII
jgi:hypothetical protein